MAKSKAVIIQRRLPHYRVSFFEALKNELQHRDIDLELLHGKCTAVEEKRQDSGFLDWATVIPTYYFLGGRICWQSIKQNLHDANLVVMMQENALLINQILIHWPRKFRVAFWGHGANLQSNNPTGLKERFKRWTTTQVDWWFAYTELSANLVKAAGFPEEKITILNNAVDTTELRNFFESITEEEKLELRRSIGFDGGPVGIYIGSLYPEKRIDFLLSAAKEIRSKVTDFSLVIIGDGPERSDVQEWCKLNPWTYYAGIQFGRDKVKYLSIADVMLNPGLIGLGILDSFACNVPLLTTDFEKHSPEIAYLKGWENGVMTENSLEGFVEGTVRLLGDPKLANRLRKGCADSALEYTLDNMKNRFADGIERAVKLEDVKGNS